MEQMLYVFSINRWKFSTEVMVQELFEALYIIWYEDNNSTNSFLQTEQIDLISNKYDTKWSVYNSV